MRTAPWKALLLSAAALLAGSAARAVDVQPAHKAAIQAAEIYKIAPKPGLARTVPPLKGKTCDEAMKLLRMRDSLLLSCEVGMPGDQAVGTINRLEPDEGQPLSQVRGVKAWIEPQPAPVKQGGTVPDLSGRTCEEARVLLQRRHLELTACDAGPPGGREVGQINAQQPGPGTPLGDVTGVTVQTEPVPAPPLPPSPTMPDLTGKTCDQARAAIVAIVERLPGLELACSAEHVPTGPTTPGQIYEQDPSAGTTLSEARVLTAWVGPAAVPPDDATAGAASAASDAATSAESPGGGATGTGTDINPDDTPPWLMLIALLGTLAAGVALWQWRKRTTRRSPAPAPTSPEVGLRALPDPRPSVSLHWSGAAPDAPAPGERLIGLRARPDAAPSHALRWLGEIDDPNGVPHD